MIAEDVDRAREAVEQALAAVAAPGWQDVPGGALLPDLLVQAETLSRMVAALQTALAGHLAEAYEHEADRQEVLGIPPGKGPHRDAADCLRDTVRIDRRTAQRRLRRAAATRPRRDFVTAPLAEPALPEVAAVLSEGAADEAACDAVVETLTRARTDLALAAVPQDEADALLAAGESLLAAQLHHADPDGMRRLCARWRQHLDAVVLPDGGIRAEAELRAAQGLFHRGRRRGLHRWDLHLTDAQHEVLQTVAAAATNPRARGAGPSGQADGPAGSPDLDPRTRGQRQADTLVSALQAALALAAPGVLPVTAGHRPQVLVTIDHETLLRRVRTASGTAAVLSEAEFTGPIDPREIRRIACDAEIIPAVLGGEGEILDLGRSRRLFTRAQRRAVTARDGGCAAPGCTLPASWCEIHHIGHWEDGGPTDVDNGVLLCSHHHHAVHAGWWTVAVVAGIPWFTPARGLDPAQTPRRNRHHRIHGPAAASGTGGAAPPASPTTPEQAGPVEPPHTPGRAGRTGRTGRTGQTEPVRPGPAAPPRPPVRRLPPPWTVLSPPWRPPGRRRPRHGGRPAGVTPRPVVVPARP